MWSRRDVKTPGRGGLGLPYMARASLRGAPPAKAGQKCPLWPAGGMESSYSEIGPEHPALQEAWPDGVGERAMASSSPSARAGRRPGKHWGRLRPGSPGSRKS